MQDVDGNEDHDDRSESTGVQDADAESTGVHDEDAESTGVRDRETEVIDNMFADATNQLDAALNETGIKAESVASDSDLEVDMDALIPPPSPNTNETIVPKVEVEDVNEDDDGNEIEEEDIADNDESDDEDYESDDEDFKASYTEPSIAPSEVRAHHNMRTRRKKRDYSYRNAFEEEFCNLMCYVLQQYHLKAGLKCFKEKGKE